ncbi:MAG: OapC/ArvC family zinc-ribbon domain-containing protein [Candidatus Heimdallarchaeaceae archaeon]
MSPARKSKIVCAVCNKEVTPSNDLLIKGCPFCGAYKFRTIVEKTREEQIEREISLVVEKDLSETLIEDEVESIRVTEKGIIEVDIQKLFEQTKESEPLIVRNKDGKYSIRIEERKEKKTSLG